MTVWAEVRDARKVAGPGELFGWPVEDAVVEGLGALSASGAGGWAVIVPGGVSAEVAFARPRVM